MKLWSRLAQGGSTSSPRKPKISPIGALSGTVAAYWREVETVVGSVSKGDSIALQGPSMPGNLAHSIDLSGFQ
jgi:hypothetical protein